MRRITIAVSGKPGAGKTTYARHLARVFELRYVSSGELFRRIAQEKGMDVVELHRLAEQDSSIDLEVDARALEEAKRGGVVVEGHLAAWLLREVADLKVVLTAPLNIRVERVASREGKSFDEAMLEVRTREESNRLRALKYYGVDIEDLSVADIVVNTAVLDIEGVKRVLEAFVREYLRLHPERR